MKRGFVSDFNRCLFAIMNPELTYSVSKYQTACGIVDIMAHTMERYFINCETTDITDRISEGILKTVISAGKTAMNTPDDYDARANIMWERWDDEYEDEYYELIRLKKTADKTNDEIEVAKYINWLLERVDFDAFDICDHSQQIVFWNEINTYIKKFLKARTSSKSKLLSYLYQMKFVHNSILLERFTDARIMFIEMMKDTGIQFNLFETMHETHNTDGIFENTGAFSFLFATWCNMYQMAFVSNDTALQEYLNDNRLFYGVPIMQNTRIEDNLELIRSGKSGLNVTYFEKQQKLIQEISEWYACEPVQTKIFFRIENMDIVKSFFEYAYDNGETTDDLINFSSYTIEDGQMVIDNYATIDLDNALRGYIPFSQTDLQ